MDDQDRKFREVLAGSRMDYSGDPWGIHWGHDGNEQHGPGVVVTYGHDGNKIVTVAPRPDRWTPESEPQERRCTVPMFTASTAPASTASTASTVSTASTASTVSTASTASEPESTPYGNRWPRADGYPLEEWSPDEWEAVNLFAPGWGPAGYFPGDDSEGAIYVGRSGETGACKVLDGNFDGFDVRVVGGRAFVLPTTDAT